MTSESPARSTGVESSTPTQSKKPTPKHVFEGHESIISSIVFLHDNVHVVSGSRDGTMRKWNCDTGLIAGEPWEGEGRPVYALALSPDGKTIACGREDGSIQRWNTDGGMIEGVWIGHSNWVRSLSWSPSGSQLASGSDDTTILIRNAESGEVHVGPIKTKQGYVHSLAYSPVGDRIASGGENETICILDSKTGDLVVGPIKDLGDTVTSSAWSSDGKKLYSASDKFAQVFDSVSGAEIHRFGHSDNLFSVALSPKGNVLGCVGIGVAQLWDTETHQHLGQLFGQEKGLYCVSFSQDGRYLACGGGNKKITLWLVNEIAPELAVRASTAFEDAPPKGTRPESPSSSYLNRDAKNPLGRPGDHEGEGSENPYKNFFRSSKTSLSLAPSNSDSRPFYRRFWTFVIPSRHRPPDDKSLPLKEKHYKRTLFRRRAREKSPLRVPATYPSEGKEGEHVEGSRIDVNCPVNSPPDACKKKMDNGKDKQRKDTLSDAQTSPADDSSPPAEDRDDKYDFQSSAPSGPSRHHAPGKKSIPQLQRPNRSSFPRLSGPRPVTIYAARPKKWYYTVRGKNRNADKKSGNTNTRTGQSSPAAAHSSSTAQPQPTKHSQQQPEAQSQAATEPAGAQYEEYDYGCWGNFWLALGCVSRHPRRINIVTVQPAGS